jgi:LmbE family N-acetylglucosaminyl deacetylase
MRVMIVVPHPDDEVLAFGGVIQRHVPMEIRYLFYFLTDVNGIDGIRAEEQIDQFPKVAKILKIQRNGRRYHV